MKPIISSLSRLLLLAGSARSLKSSENGRSYSDAVQLADEFVKQLNLTEKVSMVTGRIDLPCDGNIGPIPRLNFSGLCLHDGPAGIRIADLATLFPGGLTVGATWDRSLMYSRGFAMGMEFRGKGSHVMLGPVAGPLGRHPLGGRNWEGFGADPYLSGIAMESTIRGVQDTGVQACSKHYIGNEQETQRSNVVTNGVNTDAISSNIDDRTLHELYLWPFANSVKAGTSSIMCSYNRLNLTYTCEHSEVLNRILRTELGFQGYVMSDWFATHSGVRSVEAGLDMTMPGPLDEASARLVGQGVSTDQIPSYFGPNLTAAVTNGSIPESRVDEMVRRIMTQYYLLGQDLDFPSVDPSNLYLYYSSYGLATGFGTAPPARDVRGNHTALVREIAAAATVLLKNKGSILPIRNVTNVAVFGNDAADTTDGLYFMNRAVDGSWTYGPEIGTLPIGGGSGAGRTSDLVSPLRSIRERGLRDGFRTQYVTNNDVLAGGDFTSLFPAPDVCLVFLKTYSTEGFDRPSFENDWNSTLVVKQVANFCPNKTVVITHSAGVNTMPWESDVAVILAAHYPGEQSGNSIVDVLWGDVAPSGRLPYTIPKQASDYDFPILNLTGPEALDANAWQANFTEGLFIDYRHFDARNITPLYEFGYGLSYTTFDLSSDFTVKQLATNLSALPALTEPVAPGGTPDLWRSVLNVTITASNTGSVAGTAIPQLYMSMPKGCPGGAPQGTPNRVLRGFEAVKLSPGQSIPVTFTLTRRDLSFWSIEEQQWRIPQGQFGFDVGLSSRDLRATAKAHVI